MRGAARGAGRARLDAVLGDVGHHVVHRHLALPRRQDASVQKRQYRSGTRQYRSGTRQYRSGTRSGNVTRGARAPPPQSRRGRAQRRHSRASCAGNLGGRRGATLCGSQKLPARTWSRSRCCCTICPARRPPAHPPRSPLHLRPGVLWDRRARGGAGRGEARRGVAWEERDLRTLMRSRSCFLSPCRASVRLMSADVENSAMPTNPCRGCMGDDALGTLVQDIFSYERQETRKPAGGDAKDRPACPRAQRSSGSRKSRVARSASPARAAPPRAPPRATAPARSPRAAPSRAARPRPCLAARRARSLRRAWRGRRTRR